MKLRIKLKPADMKHSRSSKHKSWSLFSYYIISSSTHLLLQVLLLLLLLYF